MTDTILEIPHFSQIQNTDSSIAEWEKKICWLACIKMCIEFFCGQSPSLEELLEFKDVVLKWLSLRDWKEKEYTYYLPWIWWFHYGLLQIAASKGLYWRPLMTGKINTEAKFSKLIEAWCAIITSVSLWFVAKEKNWWHLVVVKWIKNWNFIINDPMNLDSVELSIEDFEKSFSWAIIVISDKDSEEFASNRAIFMDKISFWASKNTYVHLHGNEHLAESETLSFIRENAWTLLSFKQNKERFIRFEIEDAHKNKVFLRIDPNRIFDDANLEKTIKERNSHLEESLIILSMEKWLHIRNHILLKIEETNPDIIIWVHTNKLLDINDFTKKTEFVQINENLPYNAFIQTVNKNDFDDLSSMGINCVYYKDWENDWSLSDYMQAKWRRFFTVESWYHDKEVFSLLLECIKKII
ncbi:MAG: hypothetical protein ACD_3C00067G0010 [uncultured bacterium (gcode 4)]|uniref:Peptidase C39 domain-containing protein n=1 Tax=uncultured bacterium (gcode 4) TaxID=1234023 RepID=K2FB75_9BACT|nr:MAG: hypothetical protein ACD_3C00067G0010 [uncultured bacterium (gcode 4)]